MSREEHIVTYDSNIGPISIIETRRKERPEGLRKPYEYVLPRTEAESLVKELRGATKGLEAKGFQCHLVEKKGLTKGIRLHVFVLAFRPGLCGSISGVSKETWDGKVKEIQGILTSRLGPDARMYDDPWSDSAKFQIRYDAYIMHEEA